MREFDKSASFSSGACGTAIDPKTSWNPIFVFDPTREWLNTMFNPSDFFKSNLTWFAIQTGQRVNIIQHPKQSSSPKTLLLHRRILDSGSPSHSGSSCSRLLGLLFEFVVNVGGIISIVTLLLRCC